jgi:hypothetical protein
MVILTFWRTLATGQERIGQAKVANGRINIDSEVETFVADVLSGIDATNMQAVEAAFSNAPARFSGGYVRASVETDNEKYNPYHQPAGSPIGGQFAHGQLAHGPVAKFRDEYLSAVIDAPINRFSAPQYAEYRNAMRFLAGDTSQEGGMYLAPTRRSLSYWSDWISDMADLWIDEAKLDDFHETLDGALQQSLEVLSAAQP